MPLTARFQQWGGVFWNDVTDKQLNEYWMKVLDEYLERPQHLQNLKAALHLGRQDGDVYVISENIQVGKFPSLRIIFLARTAVVCCGG